MMLSCRGHHFGGFESSRAGVELGVLSIHQRHQSSPGPEGVPVRTGGGVRECVRSVLRTADSLSVCGCVGGTKVEVVVSRSPARHG